MMMHREVEEHDRCNHPNNSPYSCMVTGQCRVVYNEECCEHMHRDMMRYGEYRGCDKRVYRELTSEIFSPSQGSDPSGVEGRVLALGVAGVSSAQYTIIRSG